MQKRHGLSNPVTVNAVLFFSRDIRTRRRGESRELLELYERCSSVATVAALLQLLQLSGESRELLELYDPINSQH